MSGADKELSTIARLAYCLRSRGEGIGDVLTTAYVPVRCMCERLERRWSEIAWPARIRHPAYSLQQSQSASST
jgi:hypothetical protein